MAPNTALAIGIFTGIAATVTFGALFLFAIERGFKKMAVDLTPQFAKLDASIQALPARIASSQANAIQPSDVSAAADARAAQIDAILPAAPPAA